MRKLGRRNLETGCQKSQSLSHELSCPLCFTASPCKIHEAGRSKFEVAGLLVRERE